MSKYMVRVFLHDAKSWQQYDELDKAMEDRGFSRTLSGSKATYRLPRSEYWYKGNGSLADVRSLAAGAAEETGQAFGLVVVKADGWSVMRLKTVEPDGTADRDQNLRPPTRRG